MDFKFWSERETIWTFLGSYWFMETSTAFSHKLISTISLFFTKILLVYNFKCKLLDSRDQCPRPIKILQLVQNTDRYSSMQITYALISSDVSTLRITVVSMIPQNKKLI